MPGQQAPNATIAAFSYPETLIADYEHWVVLLRLQQVTLASLPRYGETRSFAGLAFTDAGWPAAPNLQAINEITATQRAELIGHLRDRWPG